MMINNGIDKAVEISKSVLRQTNSILEEVRGITPSGPSCEDVKPTCTVAKLDFLLQRLVELESSMRELSGFYLDQERLEKQLKNELMFQREAVNSSGQIGLGMRR